jgi:hypothetical protein
VAEYGHSLAEEKSSEQRMFECAKSMRYGQTQRLNGRSSLQKSLTVGFENFALLCHRDAVNDSVKNVNATGRSHRTPFSLAAFRTAALLTILQPLRDAPDAGSCKRGIAAL